MPTPAGFKDFGSEVLASNDVDNYLMSQSIMTFADATARDAAVTSPAEGMHAYLKDTNTLTYYTGAAWANAVTTIANDTLWDAAGDIVYATGNDVGARLPLGTADQVLTVNAGATAPEWADTAAGSQVVAGSYTGDGTADRTIALAFTPKYVILNNSDDAGNRRVWHSGITGAPANTGLQFTSSAVSMPGDAVNQVRLTTNGFIVSATGAFNSQTNGDGITYHYVAVE